MRVWLLFIVLFSLHSALAQDTFLVGLTWPKGKNGKIVDPDIVKHSGKLDFEFYNTNFKLPITFPTNYIDYYHKNDTLIVWNDPNAIGDLMQQEK